MDKKLLVKFCYDITTIICDANLNSSISMIASCCAIDFDIPSVVPLYLECQRSPCNCHSTPVGIVFQLFYF